jgi:rhodanese-related sulfurtransferase
MLAPGWTAKFAAMTTEEMLAEARKTVAEQSPSEIRGDVEGIVFVDVREIDEWEEGQISGALHLPLGSLELFADPQSPHAKPEIMVHRRRRIVVYCASGRRSLLGAKILQDLGYENVASLRGGYRAWLAEVTEP